MSVFLNVRKLLLMGLIPFAMTGCIATKSYDFKPSARTLEHNIDSNKQLPYRVIEVKTALAPEDARGDIDGAKAAIVENMRNNLDDAIVSSGLFDLNSDNDIKISVTIFKIDTPMMSTSFPADMSAEYKVTLKDKVLYKKTITSVAETEMSFSFLGGTRQMESVNRTVRKNIVNFLSDAQKELAK